MATSENALIEVESGAGTLTPFTPLTNAGDDKVFFGGTFWSGKSGYKPKIRPNGIVSGRNVVTPHASNDTVTIAAFTAFSMGVLQTVAATSASFTRPTTDEKACIYSVTMDSGGSISTVKGTIGADTTFSETRDAAGGPPLIPEDSVELAQIRIQSNTSAVVAASEIFQTMGTHAEYAGFPNFDVYHLGHGDQAQSSAEENAHVKFQSALPRIHEGPACKKVYAEYYTPSMIEISAASDFVPAEESHSVTSTPVYRKILTSASGSVGQCQFTAYLGDGVTDAILQEVGEVITARMHPDQYEDAYTLTQGKLGVSRSYPVDAQNSAACTLTPVKSEEGKTVNFSN